MKVTIHLPDRHLNTVATRLGYTDSAAINRALAVYTHVAREEQSRTPLFWERLEDERRIPVWTPLRLSTDPSHNTPVTADFPIDYFGAGTDIRTYISPEFGHKLPEMVRIGLAMLANGAVMSESAYLVRLEPTIKAFGMALRKRYISTPANLFKSLHTVARS